MKQKVDEGEQAAEWPSCKLRRAKIESKKLGLQTYISQESDELELHPACCIHIKKSYVLGGFAVHTPPFLLSFLSR